MSAYLVESVFAALLTEVDCVLVVDGRYDVESDVDAVAHDVHALVDLECIVN